MRRIADGARRVRALAGELFPSPIRDGVAHDLRTPLARLRQDLEEAKRQSRGSLQPRRPVYELSGGIFQPDAARRDWAASPRCRARAHHVNPREGAYALVQKPAPPRRILNQKVVRLRKERQNSMLWLGNVGNHCSTAIVAFLLGFAPPLAGAPSSQRAGLLSW
jgi:hypothetical protein